MTSLTFWSRIFLDQKVRDVSSSTMGETRFAQKFEQGISREGISLPVHVNFCGQVIQTAGPSFVQKYYRSSCPFVGVVNRTSDDVYLMEGSIKIGQPVRFFLQFCFCFLWFGVFAILFQALMKGHLLSDGKLIFSILQPALLVTVFLVGISAWNYFLTHDQLKRIVLAFREAANENPR